MGSTRPIDTLDACNTELRRIRATPWTAFMSPLPDVIPAEMGLRLAKFTLDTVSINNHEAEVAALQVLIAAYEALIRQEST